MPWDGPFARKTESPFRNVSTRKRSGDCRVSKRRILFRPFGQETSGTDGSAYPEPLYRTALGGRCHLQYSRLGVSQGQFRRPPPAASFLGQVPDSSQESEASCGRRNWRPVEHAANCESVIGPKRWYCRVSPRAGTLQAYEGEPLAGLLTEPPAPSPTTVSA